MQRKSFILHKDSLSVLDKLTDEQAGQLFKAISDYQNGKDLELDVLIDLVFEPFRNNFVRDEAKYKDKCEKNRDNVNKRWNKKDTTVYDRIRMDTNHTDSDSDNDSKSDNKKKNKKEKQQNIDFFQPDETSIRRINEKYPELMDYAVLVDAFIDQAKNREKPLKDYQAGFRRYLKEGWITPYSSEKQMSHSQRASMMIKNSKINNPLIPNMRIAK